jgi:hypothetical protein
MNVVVLAAHGLNCHWLGPYGNEWVNTPAFDALASESVVFDRHFATTPSAAGFRSDVEPGLNGPGRFTVLIDDRNEAIPESRAWDIVLRPSVGPDEPPGAALLRSVREAVAHVRQRDNAILWIETDRLIPPWDLEYESYQHYAEATGGFTDDGPDEAEIPEPTDSPTLGPMDPADRGLWHQVRNSFAAAVSSFDTELGRMIELFREVGLDRSAAWVVTSGHGFSLGEHGVVGPAGSRMHVEVTQLPLIVRVPEAKAGRIAKFTEPADLGAWLADPNSDIDRLIRHREFVSSRLGDEVALRTDEWTFLSGTNHPVRLYVRPDDLWEVNDVAARHPDECDRLAAMIPREVP